MTYEQEYEAAVERRYVPQSIHLETSPEMLDRMRASLAEAHAQRDAEIALRNEKLKQYTEMKAAKNKRAKQLRLEAKQNKREEELRFMAEQVALIVIKKLKEEGIV